MKNLSLVHSFYIYPYVSMSYLRYLPITRLPLRNRAAEVLQTIPSPIRDVLYGISYDWPLMSPIQGSVILAELRIAIHNWQSMVLEVYHERDSV